MTLNFQDLGTIERDEEKKKDEPSYSSWFITVNSNQKPENYESMKGWENKLKGGIRNTFEKDNWDEIFKFKVFGPILNIDLIVSAEIGSHPKGKRVHIHALVEVTHKAVLHLDYPTVHALIRQYVGAEKNIYVNIQRTTSRKQIEKYMKKGSYVPSSKHITQGLSNLKI